MKIIEKDFKIEHDGSSFVLYFLKTKKEIKESLKDEPEEFYKIKGYYSVLINAFYQIIKWRLDDKYPFKESSIELIRNYNRYSKSFKKLDIISRKLYDSIFKIKTKMYDEHKQFLNKQLLNGV